MRRAHSTVASYLTMQSATVCSHGSLSPIPKHHGWQCHVAMHIVTISWPKIRQPLQLLIISTVHVAFAVHCIISTATVAATETTVASVFLPGHRHTAVARLSWVLKFLNFPFVLTFSKLYHDILKNFIKSYINLFLKLLANI